MDTLELVIWTALLAALVPLWIGVVFEFAFSRARWAAEAAIYLVCAATYLAALSGWLAWALGKDPSAMFWLNGFSAAVAVAVGALGTRNWLGTKKRDRFADVVLQLVIWVNAALAALVLLSALSRGFGPGTHPWPTQLALAVSMTGMVTTSLVAMRAALHGDRRAWEMVTLSWLAAPLNMGLALRELAAVNWSLPVWAATCILYVVSTMVLLRAAWRRGRTHVHVSRMLDANSGRDPITRLPMGAAMVKGMDKIYSASLRMQHRPVLVVVKLFNADDIVKDSGESGLNQVLLATLARIRRVTVPADLIGRYYGACFAIQISSRVTPQYLRGFALRLAASARRPVVPLMPPSGFEDGEPIETDVGVGMCWCDDIDDLTMALHEAELAAEAAQHLRSRAAVKLSPDHEPQAVEKALGQAQLEPGLMNSATARLRGIPSQLLRKSGASSAAVALQRAVRKVKRQAGRQVTGALAAGRPGVKPSSRGMARRSVGSSHSGQTTRF